MAELKFSNKLQCEYGKHLLQKELKPTVVKAD